MISKDSIDRLVYFQREVNKLFKSIFSNDASASAKMESLFPLPMDIFDDKESIIFEMEIPGVDPKTLSLYFSGDILIVEGVKRESKRSGKCKYFCMERTFGKFRRLIEIPITANLRKVRSEFRKGILSVAIEKVSDRRGERREVPIEIVE